MDLSNLKPAGGSVRKNKRIARGQGSGKGGTATRGHKGQKSRSGYSRNYSFEGGQMPLVRRVPKYGFRNPGRVEYKAVNISTLQELAEKKNLSKIDVQTLVDNGIVSGKSLVKILGNGKLDLKLEVRAHAFSASARKAIEARQGTAETM